MALSIDYAQVKRLRTELRRLKPESPEWSKKFAQINKGAGQAIVDKAQANAASGTRQQAQAAGAIKASATQAGINIRVSASGSRPFALAAFFGMNRRVGWYAAGRYRASAGRQAPTWVGADWEVGGSGGPYAINAAIRTELDEVLEQWGDAVGELMDELNVK